MEMKKIFRLIGLAFFTLLMIAQWSAADIIDEFDAPKLDENIWDMKAVGNASFNIDDGILFMLSPGVESGIMLYCPINFEDVDVTFEVKLETSGLIDNITVGFIAEVMEPQINTDINNHWEANFFFVPANWYIKQDPVVIGEKPPNPAGMEGPFDMGWNTVKIDSSESKGTITFFLNGEEVGQVEKNPDVVGRYFYITCDPYTTHYTGWVSIEYVKFGGSGALALAVKPAGKLVDTWGNLKRGY